MAANGLTSAGPHNPGRLPDLCPEDRTEAHGEEAGLRAQDRYNIVQRLSGALQHLANDTGKSLLPELLSIRVYRTSL